MSHPNSEVSKVSSYLKALKSLSVEPGAILLMTASLISYLIFQDLMIENICIARLNLEKEVCKEIVKLNTTVYTEEVEKEIQKIFAETKTFRSILEYTGPCLFVIFLGSMSDYYGRKIFLIIPIIGYFLQISLYIVFSYYYDRMSPYALQIISAVPRSLSGGEVAYGMAAYAYICDITTHQTRTFRAGILASSISIGVPLGFYLGGQMIKNGISYASSFAISAAICVVAFAIILWRVKGSKLKGAEYQGNETGESKKPNKPTFTRNFIKVIALPFKKREGNNRAHLLLLVIAFICSATPIYGEFGLVYLFVRSRMEWNAVKYGNFSSYVSLIGIAGVVLSMGLFSKWLSIRDEIVGFISGWSQMAGCFLYAFAYTSFIMYLAPAVDMMNGTMVVIARSMCSKMVADEEIGTLLALIAVLESIIPLLANPLYSTVYEFTVNSFSGYFFILSAAFTVPAQAIFLWFICKGTEERDSNDRDMKSQENVEFGKTSGLANQTFSTD